MEKIIIVDIDGTISKPGDRLKYLQQDKPNWDAFYEACFEDEPIQEIVEMVDTLAATYQIVFCTGRKESVGEKTIEWVNKYFKNLRDNSVLLMRRNGDLRHDTRVKPELLKLAEIDLGNVAFVLEDRDSMVKCWRGLGLRCLQVAEGDF